MWAVSLWLPWWFFLLLCWVLSGCWGFFFPGVPATTTGSSKHTCRCKTISLHIHTLHIHKQTNTYFGLHVCIKGPLYIYFYQQRSPKITDTHTPKDVIIYKHIKVGTTLHLCALLPPCLSFRTGLQLWSVTLRTLPQWTKLHVCVASLGGWAECNWQVKFRTASQRWG